MSKRRPRYAVVKVTHVETKAEAENLAAMDGGAIYPLAAEKCDAKPGHRADHAHAIYDGATFCTGCEKYLSIRVEKKR